MAWGIGLDWIKGGSSGLRAGTKFFLVFEITDCWEGRLDVLVGREGTVPGYAREGTGCLFITEGFG